MRIDNIKNKKGTITLTTVILFTAMLMIAGVTLTLTSIDLSNNTKSFNNINLAQIRSSTCIEESVYRVKASTSYTGTFTSTYSDGSCVGTITNDSAPSRKVASITSSVGTSNYVTIKYIDYSTTPFTISNY